MICSSKTFTGEEGTRLNCLARAGARGVRRFARTRAREEREGRAVRFEFEFERGIASGEGDLASALRDFNNHGSNIIFATARVRELHEPLHGKVSAIHEHARDFFLL